MAEETTTNVEKLNELIGRGYRVKSVEWRALYVLEKVQEEKPVVALATKQDDIVERIKKLPFKPAKFDKTGKIFSVGPDDSSQEVKEYLKSQKWKFEDSEFSYRLSSSGWINRHALEKK